METHETYQIGNEGPRVEPSGTGEMEPTGPVSTPIIPATVYIPENVFWGELSPLQAARAITRANPQLMPAIITVKNLVPKGQGGWDLAVKHTRVVAAGDGQAALLKAVKNENPFSIRRNGQCEVCGRVFVDHELAYACCEDPKAGQPADSAYNPFGKKGVKAEWGRSWALACRECRRVHRLDADDWYDGEQLMLSNHYHWKEFPASITVDRWHPILSRFHDFQGVTAIRVDLTKVECQVAVWEAGA